MLYFEKIDTRLCFCLEKMTLSFPCATSQQSPHPTNGTPNLYHLLLIRLVIMLMVYSLRYILVGCISQPQWLRNILKVSWLCHLSSYLVSTIKMFPGELLNTSLCFLAVHLVLVPIAMTPGATWLVLIKALVTLLPTDMCRTHKMVGSILPTPL